MVKQDKTIFKLKSSAGHQHAEDCVVRRNCCGNQLINLQLKVNFETIHRTLATQ